MDIKKLDGDITKLRARKAELADELVKVGSQLELKRDALSAAYLAGDPANSIEGDIITLETRSRGLAAAVRRADEELADLAATCRGQERAAQVEISKLNAAGQKEAVSVFLDLRKTIARIEAMAVQAKQAKDLGDEYSLPAGPVTELFSYLNPFLAANKTATDALSFAAHMAQDLPAHG